MPYGAQTFWNCAGYTASFESCVMPYGAQTFVRAYFVKIEFESCVMPYGAQTELERGDWAARLRVV